MANPEIVLKRSHGWTTPLWEARQPVLARAAKKAHRGVLALGISYEEPKVGAVRRYTSEYDFAEDGFSSSSTNFQLNIATTASEKPAAVKEAADWWGAVTVHEVVHSARRENYEHVNLFERITTEGLASSAEYAYLKMFCPQQIDRRFFSKDLRHNEILEDSFQQLKLNKGLPRQRAHRWFHDTAHASVIQIGALYGVQCVQQQLENGCTFAELMQMPAKEVLGV